MMRRVGMRVVNSYGARLMLRMLWMLRVLLVLLVLGMLCMLMLWMLREMATRFGCERTRRGRGKIVWFSCDLSGGCHAP